MRGDAVVEDVDEDWPPKDERVVGDDDGFDFPSRREIPRAKLLRRSPRLVPPRFLLVAAEFRPVS